MFSYGIILWNSETSFARLDSQDSELELKPPFWLFQGVTKE